MPRCCSSTPTDFEPCFASVLVSGGSGDELKRRVEEMEMENKICPCVTGWCSKCKCVAVLVSSRGLFPCPSAHLAHLLTLRGLIEESISFK